LRFLPSPVWLDESRAQTTLSLIGQKSLTATPVPRRGRLYLQ
jgi:hypothetical protein